MALAHVSTDDPHVAAHNEERDAINDLEEQIPLLIPKPSVPQFGNMLWYNGTEWVASTSRLIEGNGQPEGVRAAPVGSTYIQLDGTTGAVRWLKAHGIDENDNTGWILEIGDTGWRNVLAQVVTPAGAAKYVANIRRINNQVDVYFDLETPNANGNWDFYTLPTGFRPTFSRYGALTDNKENAATSTYVNTAGLCRMTTIKGSWRDRFNGQWLTDDPWPSLLPGVAL